MSDADDDDKCKVEANEENTNTEKKQVPNKVL
jgi:hypothetical protein